MTVLYDKVLAGQFFWITMYKLFHHRLANTSDFSRSLPFLRSILWLYDLEDFFTVKAKNTHTQNLNNTHTRGRESTNIHLRHVNNLEVKAYWMLSTNSSNTVLLITSSGVASSQHLTYSDLTDSNTSTLYTQSTLSVIIITLCVNSCLLLIERYAHAGFNLVTYVVWQLN